MGSELPAYPDRPCPGGKVGLMADTTSPETFEEMVAWAYSTLPQKIRDLPDFPGIQVVDEPPKDVLADISNREKWRRGTELLGLYSGVHRTEHRHDLKDPIPSLPPHHGQASVQPHAKPRVSPQLANLLLNTAELGREKQKSN